MIEDTCNSNFKQKNMTPSLIARNHMFINNIVSIVHYALETYFPSEVLITNVSPWLINRGT